MAEATFMSSPTPLGRVIARLGGLLTFNRGSEPTRPPAPSGTTGCTTPDISRTCAPQNAPLPERLRATGFEVSGISSTPMTPQTSSTGKRSAADLADQEVHLRNTYGLPMMFATE